MPLPDASERAAAAVEQIGDRLDAAVLAHIATGQALPSVDTILSELRDLVRTAIRAAWDETWPGYPSTLLERTVSAVVDELAPVIAETLELARSGRRSARRLRIPDDLIPEADTDAGFTRLAEQFGLFAALGALLTVRRRRGRRVRLERDTLAQAAAAANEPLPMRLGPHLRMIVRTSTASTRNEYAADVAVEQGWVVHVRDGLLGPTDEACEDIDGRYASPEWMRRHPVGHPNCTRQGTPVRLPAGERVTLLA